MTALAIDEAASTTLAEWAADRITDGDFAGLARRMGAIPVGRDTVGFGVWVPIVGEGTAGQ